MDVDMVRFLVKQGADVNIKNESGETALTEAEAEGNADVINALKGG